MTVGAVLRNWKTASAAYVVVRLVGTVGVTPVRFRDSAGYLHLDVVHPTMRTWPVPLFYSLLPNDTYRVLAQCLVGCAAWVFFARVASARTRYPAALSAAILVVGLSPQVIRYDTAILSESLAISAAVVLATALIRTARSGGGRGFLIAAWAVFVMIRPENLILGVIVGISALVVAAARRKIVRASVAVLLIIGVAALHQLQSISTVRDVNLYTILATRVMSDSARYAWFVEHGMPNIPGIRYVEGYEYAGRIPTEIREYLRIPIEQDVPAILPAGGMELAKWVHEHGWRTYTTRILTYPGETWDLVAGYAGPALSARSHTFLPTDNRRVTPDWLFGRWQWWALATVSGLLSLTVTMRKRELMAASALTVATIILFPVVIASSGIEQQRHAAVVAVMVRLAALAALALGATASARPPDEQQLP